jgi:hypothetical protein
MSGNQLFGLYSSDEFIIQPSPRWVVKYEATDESWNSTSESYSTLNAKIYWWPLGDKRMASMSHVMELDAKYGMSVEVAAPIQKVRCHLSQLHKLRTTFICSFRTPLRFRLSISIRYTAGSQLNRRRVVAVSLW